jgi:hypothetical protein
MSLSIDKSSSNFRVAADYPSNLEPRSRLEKDRQTLESQGGGIQKEGQAYRVTISPEALKKAGLGQDGSKPLASDKTGSEADTRQVEELKSRDREVRAHEQAHVTAGGSLVRGRPVLATSPGRTENCMPSAARFRSTAAR